MSNGQSIEGLFFLIQMPELEPEDRSCKESQHCHRAVIPDKERISREGFLRVRMMRVKELVRKLTDKSFANGRREGVHSQEDGCHE